MNAIHELFGRTACLRVGWALLHFLWQGAAVAGLLAIALRLMRRRSSNARYLAACAAAAVLAAAVPLSAWLMPLPGWSPAPRSAPPVSPPVAAPPPAATPAPAIAAADATPIAPQAAPWTDRLTETLGPVLPYVVTAWIVGVALVSLWRAGGWVRVVRLKLSGRGDPGADLSARLADLARRLGVTRPVRLMRSALATTPTVIGWLRPVLLLPASAVTGLTSEQLQAVLAHELAHVRRHDYLVNLVQTAVETLLFYHPAVWWVSGRIRAERENCCDDVAAAACGGGCAYAEALVAIASLAPARPRLAIAATGGSLLARVRRLLGVPDDRPGRSTRWLGGAAAMATVLCLTLAVTLTYTPAEPADGDAGGVVTPLPAAEKTPGEFYVMGDVLRPGVFSLTGRRVTVKQALAGAGIQAGAKVPAAVVLIRRVDGKETRVTLDLPGIFAGKAPDIDVKADDVLVVGVDRLTHPPTTAPSRRPAPRVAVARRAEEVYVMGSVQRPGLYSIAGRRVTLLQVLASAAFEPHKNKGMTAVLLRRAPDGSQSRTDYDIDAILAGKVANPTLQAGDVVTVLAESNPRAAATAEQQRDLTEESARVRRQLEEARDRFGPNHRDVKALESNLKGLEAYMAALQVPAGTGSGVGRPGDTAKKREAEKKLSGVLSKVDFTGIGLGDVIQFLRDKVGLNIVVDWQGLMAVAVDQRSPVTVQLQDVSARKALEKVLQTVPRDGDSKLQFDVDEEGVITISVAPSPTPMLDKAMTGLGPGGRVSGPRTFSPPSPSMGGMGPPAAPAPPRVVQVFRVSDVIDKLLQRPDVDGDKTKAYASLAELVRDHAGSGKLNIAADLSAGALIVSAPKPQMDAVQAVLESLAKYADRQILVSSAILKLLPDDESALRKRLGKLQGKPVQPDRAEEFTLDAEAVGQLRALAAKIKDVKALASPRVLLQNFCPGMVKVGQKVPVRLREPDGGMGMGGGVFGGAGRQPGQGHVATAQVDVPLSLSVDAWIRPDGKRISLTADVQYAQPDWLTWEKAPELKIASASLSGTVEAGKSMLLRIPLAYSRRQRLISFNRTKVNGKEQFEVVRGKLRTPDKPMIEGYLYVFLTPAIK